jgi:CubicO group peptidase (beta-lactamase class C family)
MTAPYKYKSEPWTKVCTSNDWTKAALDILGGRKGITGEFKYSTLGIQILSGVIANASGMKVIDFANAYLFETLGIPRHRIRKSAQKKSNSTF